MTWQHWIIAVLYGLSVALGPMSIGQTRTMTARRATGNSLTAIALLALLVWGQR